MLSLLLVALLATIPYYYCQVAVQQVAEGSQVRIQCRPTSPLPNLPIRYEWYNPANQLVSVDRDLIITNFQRNNEGFYTCKASQNIDGRIIPSQNQVRLVLQSGSGGGGSVDFRVDADTTYDTFVNGMIFLNCKAEPAGSYTFEWIEPNGKSTSNGQIFYNNVNKEAGGRYTCRVTRQTDNAVKETYSIVNVQDIPISTRIVSGSPNIGSTINLNCEVDKSRTRDRVYSSFSYQWIAPNGQVLSESGQVNVPLTSSSQFGRYICRVNAIGTSPPYTQDQSVDILSTNTGGGGGGGGTDFGRNAELNIRRVPDQIKFLQRVILQCILSGDLRNPTYMFRFNGQVVSTGSEHTINNLRPEQLGVYTCEVRGYDPRTNAPVSVERNIDVKLDYTKNFKIELKVPPGPYLITKSGDRRELHCEIDSTSNSRGKDVIWYFNGQLLNPSNQQQYRLIRNDRIFVSILVATRIGRDNVGNYRCEINGIVKEANIVVLEGVREISVLPKNEVRKVGDRIPVEFHCRIEGYESRTNRDVTWYFQPTSNPTQRVPLDMRRWTRSDSSATLDTSFITLENAQVIDDGSYICIEPNSGDTDTTTLKVIDDLKIFVTPPSQTVRAGQSANVQCYVTQAGPNPPYPTLFFANNGLEVNSDRRVNVLRLEPGKIQMTMSNLRVDENNIQLICRSGVKSASAEIRVERVCTNGYRLCRNGQCINAAKFCDNQRDCTDGSDEDPAYCNKCDPLTRPCQMMSGRQFLQPTYQAHWECDGEDDCGNGYDESRCSGHVATCGGMTYRCIDGSKTIAKSFVCDGERDCPNGDDESACVAPTIIRQPSNEYQLNSRRGTTVILSCEAQGFPLPRIIWRFNWGCINGNPIPSGRVIQTEDYSNCRSTISTLTITNFQPGDDGVYNCEAIGGRKRAWSPDYSVLVDMRNIQH